MSSSPFDLLPIEIIQKIFVLCLPENNQICLPPKESYVVQLVISQVSSRWRSIALDTRQLWNNIILSLNNKNLRTRRSSLYRQERTESTSGLALPCRPGAECSPIAVQVPALQLASLWLHRARGLPIALKVQTDLPHDDPRIYYLCRLISAHQFKSLEGNLKNHWLMLCDESYEESFAFLNSLYLEFPVHPFQERKSPSSGDYCQLPSLRSVHLNFNRVPVSRERDLYMIPWHQLTTLVIHNATNFSTIIDIMRECEALVECKLLKLHADANVRIESLKTALPHLCNLELTSRRPIEDSIQALSTFNLPKLTSIHLFHLIHLTITGSETQTDTLRDTDWLSSQLRVSAPFQQLHEFTLSDPRNILDVRIFLRNMPSLRKLTLHGYVFLDHHTADEISTGQLGAYIDTISLRSCCSVIIVRRILDMIEKRQENAKSEEGLNLQPFIHIRLGCPASMGNEYKERVEHLERQHDVQIQMDPIHI